PVLYAMTHNLSFKRTIAKRKINRRNKRGALALILGLCSLSGYSQTGLDLEALKTLALENNKGLRAEALKVDRAEALRGTAWEFDKTEIYYQYDENNLDLAGQPLTVFGL